jgi:hypothetical protein
MNTLNGLVQYIYDSVDVVSRELTGLIDAVTRSSAAEGVSVGQDVTYDIVPAAVAGDITPAATPPALGDTTVGAGTMTITKARGSRFYWTGDDEAKLGREARGNITENKFTQAFRTLANEIEADLAALYVSASRATGSAGTTPFATAGDFSDVANAVKILKDNGAPTTDIQLVVNTAAGAQVIGKHSRYDIAGDPRQARTGLFFPIAGATIRESAQIKNHTKGTGASYLTNSSALTAGVTAIPADTGSGTVLAGDVINFADDAPDYSYVVASALSGGSLSIAAPGLMGAVGNNKAITLAANYAANMCFARSAVHLLTRLPLMPEGGDAARDMMIVQDPVSGLFFRIAEYAGYHAVQYEVSIAWGVKAVKSEHMALLLG